MVPSALATAAVLAVYPFDVVIDFSALPPKGTAAKGYDFLVTIDLATGRQVTVPVSVGRTAEPHDVWDGVATSLNPDWWEMRTGPLTITLSKGNGSPVRRVVITGDGPKPAVRWVPKPER